MGDSKSGQRALLLLQYVQTAAMLPKCFPCSNSTTSRSLRQRSSIARYRGMPGSSMPLNKPDSTCRVRACALKVAVFCGEGLQQSAQRNRGETKQRCRQKQAKVPAPLIGPEPADSGLPMPQLQTMPLHAPHLSECDPCSCQVRLTLYRNKHHGMP